MCHRAGGEARVVRRQAGPAEGRGNWRVPRDGGRPGRRISRTCPGELAQVAFGMLANLPPVVVTSLVAFSVISPSPGLALGGGAVLAALGWRVASALFDRERLITGTR